MAIKDLKKETGDSFWNYAMAYITSIYGNGLMIGGVDRVMNTISTYSDKMEIASIDEAYLDVTGEWKIMFIFWKTRKK